MSSHTTTGNPSMRLELELNDSFDRDISPLLTEIDEIRNEMESSDDTIELPTIVVIGEQSAGKSSVLEALSGIPLPRAGQTMTTKCPLELRLRRGKVWEASLSSGDTVIQDRISAREDITDLINKQQDRLTNKRNTISKQILTLTVKAEWLPDLTLIDLPGIIQVSWNHQDANIVQTIDEIIDNYLKRRSTIILAVIQSSNDIETSVALKKTKKWDPKGQRTIGVLTKPDLVDRGVEEKVLEILQNERIPLTHGYFLVKCRSQDEINRKTTLKEAQAKEIEFFSGSSKFRSVPVERRGISSLARYLTRELVQSIRTAIPTLIVTAQNELRRIEEELHELSVDSSVDLTSNNENRTRYLTEKFFRETQAFADRIRRVKEGEQIGVSLYAERNEYNKQFYDGMQRCKLTNRQLVQTIRGKMVSTQGPEPSDYILFRIAKSVCSIYVEHITSPMSSFLSSMFGKVNRTINHVINECFRHRPNLKEQIRCLHQEIETNLKQECQKEMQLVIEMEKSFVYTDNQFYKDAVTRHRIEQRERDHTQTNQNNKRTLNLITDDEEESSNPPKRQSWFWPRNERQGPSTTAHIETAPIPAPNHSATNKPEPSTESNTHDSTEVLEYKIRVLAMQDVICQRILLSFPQRVEFQLIEKQFSQLEFKLNLFSSQCLDKIDSLMMYEPAVQQKLDRLYSRKKIYEHIIRRLQKIEHYSVQ